MITEDITQERKYIWIIGIFNYSSGKVKKLKVTDG